MDVEKTVLENGSAKLLDIGDGVARLEFTTKMNILEPTTFDLIIQSIDKVKEEFAGLVIGDNDENFSAGLNLNLVLDACEKRDWDSASSIIRQGQKTMMALKYAPFPVVGAVAGLAVGGGCEMMLHSDYIQAHKECRIGLVEINIGVVPSWGGCKEMLVHHLGDISSDSGAALQACADVFDIISHAKISSSATDAEKILAAKGRLGVTDNKDNLIKDAKEQCIRLAKDYHTPEQKPIKIPGGAAMVVYNNEIKRRLDIGEITQYESKVLKYLCYVLSGGFTDATILGELQLSAMSERSNDNTMLEFSEQDILDMEHNSFVSLVKNMETQDKIRKVLKRKS